MLRNQPKFNHKQFNSLLRMRFESNSSPSSEFLNRGETIVTPGQHQTRLKSYMTSPKGFDSVNEAVSFNINRTCEMKKKPSPCSNSKQDFNSRQNVINELNLKSESIHTAHITGYEPHSTSFIEIPFEYSDKRNGSSYNYVEFGVKFEAGLEKISINQNFNVLKWKSGSGDRGIDKFVGLSDSESFKGNKSQLIKSIFMDLSLFQCKYKINPSNINRPYAEINHKTLQKLTSSYYLSKSYYKGSLSAILVSNAEMRHNIRQAFDDLAIPAVFLQISNNESFEKYIATNDISHLDDFDFSHCKFLSNKLFEARLDESNRKQNTLLMHYSVNVGMNHTRNALQLIPVIENLMKNNEKYSELQKEHSVMIGSDILNNYSLSGDSKSLSLKIPVMIERNATEKQKLSAIFEVSSYLNALSDKLTKSQSNEKLTPQKPLLSD